MKYFISLLSAAFVVTGLFSPVSLAADNALPKLNLLYTDTVQTPFSRNPLSKNILKVGHYVRWRHGRKQICYRRHCNYWIKKHNHHGGHYRVCGSWHYTNCHYVKHHHHGY